MKKQILLITTFAIASLGAQETAVDPYAKNQKEAPEAKPVEDPKNISICYEDFSLPLHVAAALQREHLSGAALYAKILSAVGKDGVRQETFAMLRGRSGEKFTTESITEDIYPSEYEGGELSNAVTTSIQAPDKESKSQGGAPVGMARTPACPSAFETRNAGFALEVEPTLSENGAWVDVNLAPEHVTLVGKSTAGQEFSTTEMPIFECQRIHTSITVKVNVPFLLGTVNRPPGSKQEVDATPRAWFAFITAKAPKS